MSGLGRDLEVGREGHVAIVEMRRPPHNFLDATLLSDLAETFEALDRDPDVRCVILQSEGKSFCAGADFSRDEGSGDIARKFYAAAVRLFATRKPSIAVINGASIGAGLGLALFADFRFATPESRFAANFVKLGIHPGFAITHTLPRLIGEQAAALLLYTGRRINGQEAVRIGLADFLVSGDDLRGAALSLAREIAENAPLAVVATRATLRDGLSELVAAQTRHEVAEQERLFETTDYREGVRAVAERRPGNFTGR